MTNETLLISPLHQRYVLESGQSIQMTMARIFAWSAWKQKGWTEEELTLVIRYLKKLINEGKKWSSCLLFSKLVQDTEGFEELLGMARADARRPKVCSGKASVLRATGRLTEPMAMARSAADIMAGEAAFKEFLRMKDGL